MFPFKNYKNCRITCEYGIKGNWKSGKHDGVDIVSDGDITILSVCDGKVIRSTHSLSWGNYVVVEMADGRSIVYAHLSKRYVSVGEKVTAGQFIGVMGNTGNSTGAHLHIELQRNYYKCGDVDDITDFLQIENKKGTVVMKLTLDESIEIIKQKAGLSDETIAFLLCYKYGNDLLIKLATAIKGGR